MELEGLKKNNLFHDKLPENWGFTTLGDVIELKNGYALKSEFFDNSGPIVITPGNFKIEGGLKFNPSNTIRYNGSYSTEVQLRKGDLLIVMTDLTPDCNLLGKAGIVSTNDLILHNQRIGKIILKSNKVDSLFLLCYFNSPLFSARMKATATGSTVRHTSVPTIKNTQILTPPVPEQKAIARVLSDTDTLIQALEKKIAKKKLIKQGVMQKLLTPKEGWEVKKLGEIAEVIRGASPRPQGDKRFFGGDIPRLMVEDVTRDGKYVSPKVDFLTEEGAKRSRPCKAGTLTIVCSGTVGIPSILAVDACIHDGFLALIKINKGYYTDFIYHSLTTLRTKFENSATHGGVFTNLTTDGLREFEVSFPSFQNQVEIAKMLTDIDENLNALRSSLTKNKRLKQALMQQLLTGKIRLV